jgi:biopolymer transport protein ExbB/TolQ
VSTHDIEQFIFNVAHALLVPVLILVLLALAVVVVETGRLIGEVINRRHRSIAALDTAAADITHQLGRADSGVTDQSDAASASMVAASRVAPSKAMAETLWALVEHWSDPQRATDPERTAKLLADFDYRSVRRLERTRILVRLGPALGLMGTLIPLSPALAALAKGDVTTLSNNLRVAFSVTILGLMVGALAFGISLVRDRIYSQDLSDLEYLTAAVESSRPGIESRETV